MRDLKAAQLLTEEIILQDVFVKLVQEPRGYSLSFKDNPRTCNVLCLYCSGSRVYTVPGGQDFELTAGNILYIPQGGRYSFRIIDTAGQSADYLIAIHFNMKDRNGDPVIYGEFPRVLLQDRLDHYFTLFHRMEKTCRNGISSVMLLKSQVYALFYEILSELQQAEDMKQPWNIILPAIRLMESDPAQDLPIPELARKCGVSETRFRKLWNDYTDGISPVDYRNRLRIDLAEKLLRTEIVTVESAARQSGFRDLSHFYRMYRKLKGTAPLMRE